MFRRMVGLVCLMAGLAAIVASSVCGFSSKQCRRCGAPKRNGAQSSPAAAAQVPRRNRKRGARPTQKPSTPPEYNLAKVLDGLKDNEHFKDSEELAAMQAKMEQAWEADKLAKRQARTPEVAVQAAFSALQNRKAAMAKSQAKISELEAAAQKAAEAVEEAKQKARPIARGNRQAIERVR